MMTTLIVVVLGKLKVVFQLKRNAMVEKNNTSHYITACLLSLSIFIKFYKYQELDTFLTEQ